MFKNLGIVDMRLINALLKSIPHLKAQFGNTSRVVAKSIDQPYLIKSESLIRPIRVAQTSTSGLSTIPHGLSPHYIRTPMSFCPLRISRFAYRLPTIICPTSTPLNVS